MIGIIGYGCYVPLFALGPGAKGWNWPSTRSVAAFDEDSITMAVAAANNCLRKQDRESIDGLFFASTTSPYAEKQAASIVATATDLRSDILTTDYIGCLRSGTIALRAAVDAVKAGTAKKVLVVAADNRQLPAGSLLEGSFGDGAAAILISDSNVAVDVGDSCFLQQEIFDTWRAQEDATVRSAEERFWLDEGYTKSVTEVASKLMTWENLKPGDFARLILYAPESRRQTRMARELGFDVERQLQDSMFWDVGNTGAASILMMLTCSLQEAKPGDKLLLLNYGNGADAFPLIVTEEITKIRDERGLGWHLERRKMLDDYMTYARWRGFIDMAMVPGLALPTPTPAPLWREQDKNLRLHGSRCKQCGRPQFPQQRICIECGSKDNFDIERFSDKKGRIFTYTFDIFVPTRNPPVIVVWVDFEGGGRMVGQLTDIDYNEVQIDIPVQMAFRKIGFSGGIHNYYWKFVPARD